MDELFKNTAYRILESFIASPTNDFSVRGIARRLGLSHATVSRYINDLERLELIKKKKETLYPTYFANTQNQRYRFYKRNHLLSEVMESGVVEYIQQECLPSSMILFGSGAKATFTQDSDIDIFVEAKEARLDLQRYEKRLNKTINLLFEPDINDLSQELLHNIINGVVLYGFIRVHGVRHGK